MITSDLGEEFQNDLHKNLGLIGIHDLLSTPYHHQVGHPLTHCWACYDHPAMCHMASPGALVYEPEMYISPCFQWEF